MAVASADVSPFLELKEDCSRAAIFASRDDMVSACVAMVIAVWAMFGGNRDLMIFPAAIDRWELINI